MELLSETQLKSLCLPYLARVSKMTTQLEGEREAKMVVVMYEVGEDVEGAIECIEDFWGEESEQTCSDIETVSASSDDKELPKQN